MKPVVEFNKRALICIFLMITSFYEVAAKYTEPNEKEVVIEGKKPEFIKLLDEKTGEIKRINFDEYKRIFKSVYSEDVVFPKKGGGYHPDIKEWTKKIIEQSNSQKEITKKTLQRIENPCTKLALRKTSEKHGYHLIATENIPTGTVLALYTGIAYEKTQPNSVYDMSCPYQGEAKLYISPYRQGGIARFMASLPRKRKTYGAYSLEDYIFNDQIKERIATTNVSIKLVSIKEFPVLSVISIQEIEAGEPIGYNYGKQYWLNLEIKPLLFDKSGGLLSSSLYQHKLKPF